MSLTSIGVCDLLGGRKQKVKSMDKPRNQIELQEGGTREGPRRLHQLSATSWGSMCFWGTSMKSRLKRFILYLHNYLYLPKSITQWLFDTFKLGGV